MGLVENVRVNIEVISVINELLEMKSRPNANQLEKLNSFKGWGTVNDFFYKEEKYKNLRLFFDKEIERLSKNMDVPTEVINKEIRNSLGNMYFTPKKIGEYVHNEFKNKGYQFANTLEPACGTGNLIGNNNNVTGVEKNLIASLIAGYVYPKAKIRYNSFEDFKPSQLFDLTITNVPFSKNKVYDPNISKDISKEITKTLHGYFTYKSIDLTAHNGHIVLITPTGVMDSESNQKLREIVTNKADFLGALRMPNVTFKDENTRVVTDLMFFRKNDLKKELTSLDQEFIKSSKIEIHHPDKGMDKYPISQYYLGMGKGNILGDFQVGRMHAGYNLDVVANSSMKGKFKEVLSQVIPGEVKIQVGQLDLFDNNIDNVFKKTLEEEFRDMLDISKERDADQKNEKLFNEIGDRQYFSYKKIIKNKFLKEANNKKRILEISKEKKYKNLGKKKTRERAQLTVIEATDGRIKNLKDISLFLKERGKESLSYKEGLNNLYDGFTKKYGRLNDKSNKDIIKATFDNFGEILTLEKSNGKKSDIFSFKEPDEIRLNDPVDLMISSLNKFGKLNEEYINKGNEAGFIYLIENAYIFKNHKTDKYEIREIYLSGNVKKKLEEVREIVKTNDSLRPNLKALEQVIPPYIKIEDLDINFGERWIDSKVYEDFMKDMMRIDFNIDYSKNMDQYYVSWGERRYKENLDKSIGHYHVVDIIECALLNKTPEIKTIITEGMEKKTIVNKKKTRELNNEIETIRNRWKQYIIKNEVVSKHLEVKYNELFNNSISLNLDSLENKIKIKGYELRDYQSNYVLKASLIMEE